MEIYGLIGKSLSHSFSKSYFEGKFKALGLSKCEYRNFELQDIGDVKSVLNSLHNIMGLNVTVPYKEQIIPYLDELDESARKVGAVNVVKPMNEKWVGYNSDVYGFQQSLTDWLGDQKPQTLILGTGGASKAVSVALDNLQIPFQLVSRTSNRGNLTYEEVDYSQFQLIINTTPLGTFPDIDSCPDINYQQLSEQHFLYDLVYNPEQTEFLKRGLGNGAKVKNGLEMLKLQAERSWELWNATQ